SAMRNWNGRARVVVPLALVLSGAIAVFARQGGEAEGPEDAPTRVPEASRVVEPIAPDLPAGIVAALQEGRYDEAAEALDAWGSAGDADADRRAFAALIRGIALRLDDQPDPARDALTAALQAEPDGRWSAKLRAELAATELAADRPEQAEAL